MNTDMKTNIFGMIFASTQFKAALESLSQNGLTFEGLWALAGAVGVVLWAYFTNKESE